MGWCNYFSWGFIPSFFWIFFWVIIGWFFWGRRWSRGGYRHNHENSPEEILKERFAKGEIDEEEYKKKIDVLKKHS